VHFGNIVMQNTVYRPSSEDNPAYQKTLRGEGHSAAVWGHP